MAFRKQPPYLDPADADLVLHFGKMWDFTHGPGTNPVQFNTKIDSQWANVVDELSEQLRMTRPQYVRFCVKSVTMALGDKAKNGILPEELALIAKIEELGLAEEIQQQIEYWEKLRTNLKETEHHLASLPRGSDEIAAHVNKWRERMKKMTASAVELVESELGRWL